MDISEAIGIGGVAVAIVSVGVGVIMGRASLREAKRSGDAAAASAEASKESAEAAIESNRFQQRLLDESKRADLHVLRAQTYAWTAPRTGLGLLFDVRNEGRAPVFDVRFERSTSISTSPAQGLEGSATAIESLDETSVEFQVVPGIPVSVGNGSRPGELMITYRDGRGPHRLVFSFMFEFQEGKLVPMEIRSVTLDGQPHHQHPEGMPII